MSYSPLKANTLGNAVGFVLAVVLAVAIAKRVPYVKRLL